MHPDLKHDAAGHAFRRVAPGGEIELAFAVSADVGLGLNQLAERAFRDAVPDPFEMIFPAALVTDGKDDATILDDAGDCLGVGNGV